MYNWSVDEKKFKKANPKAYQLWRLEQMINYGLQGERLNSRLLRKNWDKIFMDPVKKQYLKFLLWPSKRKY